MFVDSHCHLNDARMSSDIDGSIASAREAGVTAFVLGGTDQASWRAQSRLAARHADVWPVYGIHPWWAATMDNAVLEANLDALTKACAANAGELGGLRRPVALGETGLDGSRLAPPNSLAAQTVAFRAQLKLATEFELPVVLHVLKAHDEALRVLGDVGAPFGGIVHSYSGSAEHVRRYEALGLHISFSGAVTRPQSRKLRSAAAAVSAERLLIETDAPDQTPHPHHREQNTPALLPLIAEAVAQARGSSSADIAALTSSNARRLFGLPTLA